MRVGLQEPINVQYSGRGTRLLANPFKIFQLFVETQAACSKFFFAWCPFQSFETSNSGKHAPWSHVRTPRLIICSTPHTRQHHDGHRSFLLLPYLALGCCFLMFDLPRPINLYRCELHSLGCLQRLGWTSSSTTPKVPFSQFLGV